MRIGLIADIHGNLLALDTVLGELAEQRVDEIICLGDIAVGPQGPEALERVEALDCRVVMGNWDSYFLHGFPDLEGPIGPRLVEVGAWWADKLQPAHLEYMRSFEPIIELRVGSEPVLLAFHGSPRSFEDEILATTPDAEVASMLGERRVPVMAGGHTHFQMLRRHGVTTLVNPGSVGLPFSRPAPVMRIAPWAEYALVDWQDDGLAVELRRTAIDVDSFTHLLLESGMPHAEWWASLWTGTTLRLGRTNGEHR